MARVGRMNEITSGVRPESSWEGVFVIGESRGLQSAGSGVSCSFWLPLCQEASEVIFGL